MSRTVGIMSMQRIRNYGSSLQAYGLKRMLEGIDSDAQIQFVDYRPGAAVSTDDSRRTRRASALEKLTTIQDLHRMDGKLREKLKYVKHRRTYERRYFPLVGVPQEPRFDADLDLLVIGSDEVFNFTQSTHEVGYAPELFGHASQADRIVSYAASFGNTTLSRLSASGKEDEIRDGLDRFESISVRDENSADIVEHLIGRRPMIHLDPVLAYDFLALEPRIPVSRQLDDRYVLVYGYPGRFSRSENDAIARYAQSIDSRVVCIGGMQDCCETYIDCDPFEVLAYFRDAHAVVTDTYHGSILSIINERPFVSLVRQSTATHYGNVEKLGYLLSDLGLGSQRVSGSDQIQVALGEHIDYRSVAERLEQERRRTAEYLSAAMSDARR